MTMSSQRLAGAGKFGLAWLLVNAAGWGLGFGLELWLVHSSGLGGLTGLFGILLAAGVIGLAQWLALRWLLERMRPGSQGIAWVVLTMFGFAAGFLSASLISGMFHENLSPEASTLLTFVSWALVGLVTGGLQWMAMQFMARGALWWVFANALGYGFGALLMTVAQIELNFGSFAYALAGLLVGATTLVAISRLRRRIY